MSDLGIYILYLLVINTVPRQCKGLRTFQFHLFTRDFCVIVGVYKVYMYFIFHIIFIL